MIFPTCIIDILHVFVSSDTIHEVRLAENDKEFTAKLSYFFSCFGSGEKNNFNDVYRFAGRA